MLRGRLDLAEVHTIELFGNELETLRLQGGDLLIVEGNGSKSEIGRSAIWDGSIENCVHQNHLIRARPVQCLPQYINYYLNSPEGAEQITALAASTSGLYTLSVSKIARLAIPLAPLNEQRCIVARIDELLTRLDAGVAALKRVQANLKRYRAAVLAAAVEGRLTAEWRAAHPPSEDGPALLARILAERRRAWEEAERTRYAQAGKTPPLDWGLRYREPPAPETAGLPALPEGWCWVAVGQLADLGTGATPQTTNPRYYDGGTIPWITSAAVNNTYVETPSGYVTEAALEETNLTLYPPGTLLVAMYGEGRTRGKCAELRIKACTNQALAALQLRASAIRAKVYLHYFFQHNYDSTRHLSAGGVQPNLNLGLIRQLVLPLPPPDEMQEIVAEVERRLSAVAHVEERAEASLARAERLRQSILKRAFEGKLAAQDPGDEPASALLARIRQAREAETRRAQSAQKTRKARGAGAPRRREAEGQLALRALE